MLWKNKLLNKILYCFKNKKFEFNNDQNLIKLIISKVVFYIPFYNNYKYIDFFLLNSFYDYSFTHLHERLITSFKTISRDIRYIKEDIVKCLQKINLK